MNALTETDFILSEHFIPGCLYGYCIYFTTEMGMTAEMYDRNGITDDVMCMTLYDDGNSRTDDVMCMTLYHDGNSRTDNVMCMMLYHDGNGQGRRRDVYDAVSRRKRTGQAT